LRYEHCYSSSKSTTIPQLNKLPLHDALPISTVAEAPAAGRPEPAAAADPNSPLGLWATEGGKGNVVIEPCGTNICGFAEKTRERTEEHTSKHQSPCNIVCHFLLEKKTITNLS